MISWYQWSAMLFFSFCTFFNNPFIKNVHKIGLNPFFHIEVSLKQRYINSKATHREVSINISSHIQFKHRVNRKTWFWDSPLMCTLWKLNISLGSRLRRRITTNLHCLMDLVREDLSRALFEGAADFDWLSSNLHNVVSIACICKLLRFTKERGEILFVRSTKIRHFFSLSIFLFCTRVILFFF